METDISIRPYRLDDAAALHEAAIESVWEIRPFMPWCRPDLTLDEGRCWIEAQVSAFAARKAFEFVISAPDGRFLGSCGTVKGTGCFSSLSAPKIPSLLPLCGYICCFAGQWQPD